jgi:hypothetical protein
MDSMRVWGALGMRRRRPCWRRYTSCRPYNRSLKSSSKKSSSNSNHTRHSRAMMTEGKDGGSTTTAGIKEHNNYMTLLQMPSQAMLMMLA